jgi:aspartate/methionine/tyrosine aminotransferase
MTAIKTQENFRIPQRLQGLEKSLIRQVADRALPGSISFGLGEPDLPTPDCIKREAIRVITEEMNGYTLQAGLLTLRQKIISDYPHMNLSPDDCFVTVGSSEALFVALMTLVEQGDEVLMPDPSFPAYPSITTIAGGKSLYYRLPKEKGFSFDIEEFQKHITPKTRAVIILSPSNPTGRTLTRDELKQIADVLKDTGIYVISDEIYRDLYYTEERPASISEFYERTVILSGLSKSMSMTGWRLGWLAGISEVAKSAHVLHGYDVTCANTIAQKSALIAWTDEGQKAKASAREIFRKRRDLLVELIESELQLPAISPEGAFYSMLDVRSLGDEMEVVEKFMANKVVTIPGKAFGKESEGFLRISFCADEEKIREGVKRMKATLDGATP